MAEAKKGKGFLRVLLSIVSSLVGIFLLFALLNLIFNIALRQYIKSFSPVSYDASHTLVEPTLNAEQDYVFKTDGDFKIMQITDFHIGGGFLSYSKDKKAIRCAMTMVQNEKPDLLIYTGDNTFAIPYIAGTINNYMVAKTFIEMNERLGVYWTTVFGNHDTEAFGYANRQAISNLYKNDKYHKCIYQSAEGITGKSNSCILIEKNDGTITKLLVLIDSNDYQSKNIKDTINWNYDTIHDDEVNWAKAKIDHYTEVNGGVLVKSLFFFHIPISEYEIAYQELKDNNFNDTANTKYISGLCDEEVNEVLNNGKGRIWYGGDRQEIDDISKLDSLFEKVSYSAEGMFCGHDHVNNIVMEYKGVLFSYGYSVDYLAYSKISTYGLQRGNTTIVVHNDGSWDETHNNYYTSGYVCEKGPIEEVNMDKWLYEDQLPNPHKTDSYHHD